MSVREAIQYVEIDLPICARVYGVAPCTAAIGVTGDAKCFNTLATCQDAANYSATSVTLRVSEDRPYRDLTIEALPLVVSVAFNPAVLKPGQDLGERATVTVTLRDMPHSDTGAGFDPYQASRGYDPRGQGTLFGRFRARYPYLRGVELRWYQGFADQALADMECRTFVVEATNGPSVDGKFTVTAIDPLRMLAGDRAQAPVLNTGRLTADITDVATSATLTPAGIGNTEYAASGYVAIGGSEIAAFTRAGDVLTLTRGQLGTSAEAHSAQDRVQQVLRYSAADPADAIYDLMVTYGGVPASYINLSEWEAEIAAYLGRNYTTVIGDPMPVAQLVGELMVEAGLSIWWDDLAGKIRLRVIRALTPDAQAFSAENMLPGTFQRTDQPDARISQVRVFFARKNPVKGSDETDNFAQVRVVADLDNEANYGSAAIREVWARWIPTGGTSAAQRVGELLVSRFKVPPRRFVFEVMRGVVSPAPSLGNLYSLSWRTEQQADGTAETVPVQIVRLTALKDRWQIEAEEMQLAGEDTTERGITIDYDVNDLNMRDLHDALYPAPLGGETVTLLIAEGVTVGASSTAGPALDTGTWPTRAQTATRTSGSAILTGLSVNTSGLAAGMRVYGTGIQAGSKILSVDSLSQITLDKTASSSGSGTVTVQTVILEVNVLGTVQGAGGAGGTGADGNGDVPGTNGSAGGTALLVRAEIELTDADGALWGGGGGGGGGPCRNPPDHKGGGGGGGAGTVGGAGGVGPGAGRDGAAGTASAGGAGGHGWTNNNFFAGPEDDGTRRGGDGGGPGLAGQNGQGSSDVGKGNGGAAGNAIDGLSKINTVGSAGDRRGGQIN